MPADELLSVALRGINLIAAKYKRKGTAIRKIRDKGQSLINTLSPDLTSFNGMMTSIEGLMISFEDAWQEAVTYSVERGVTPAFPSSEDEEYYSDVQNCYFEAKGFNIRLSAINNPNPRQSLPNLDVTQSQARTILPKIPIRRFSGDMAQWATFKQLFSSLIRDETSLSNSERFHYLVSYLEGPAYDTIRHIAVTEENFEQAWAALLKVYDDHRKMACTYLERLLKYKAPTGKPTNASLQLYLSNVMESITSLENLKIPEFSNYLLCELALRGLDPITREAFEIHNVGTEFPKYSDLQTFVQNRCHVLRITAESAESGDTRREATPSAPKAPNKYSQSRQALLAHTYHSTSPGDSRSARFSTPRSCCICGSDHSIVGCPKFRAGTPSERLELLRNFPGCRNCLHPKHRTRECTSLHKCRECGGKHHSDLHLPSKPQDMAKPAAPSSTLPPSRVEKSSPSTSPNSFVGASTSSETGVLLGTVVAELKDAHGNPHRFRGILDPGSQYSFVTSNCAQKLNKSTRQFCGSISGVNHSPLQNVKGRITLSLHHRYSSDLLETNALVIPSITPYLPQSSLTSPMWDDYLTYDLSDPHFTVPGPIDFLIGADLYPEIITGVPVTLHHTGPRLIQTIFGFVVIGRFSRKSSSSPDCNLSLLAHGDLAPLIERFWEVEEPSSAPQGDDQCEQHFLTTHYRQEDGRYVVRLPFKSYPPNIKPNYRQSSNRFFTLETRLSKDPLLREDYSAFLAEYEQLGHMSLSTISPSYIIPHHPVYKINGDNRKLRVVFDASCPTATGSLNDHLLPGPKLQIDICVILSNFRRHTYVFSCDIIKMFRQIVVDPADRPYQQIAWRFEPGEPLRFYTLNTVTYGLRCSPYLAQRVLRQHATNYCAQYPEAADILTNNTYVDDIVAGSDSVDQLLQLREELTDLLSKGGFELSKWSSNCPALFNSGESSFDTINFCKEEAVATKILGMRWDPVSDCFSYEVSVPPPGHTKRIILSTIARLFDPLGLLAPAVFYAKCIFQSTWQCHADWDDEVPPDVCSLWSQFVEALPQLSTIQIPRALPKTDSTYQFLCFSDASERGYCAVIYLRSTLGSVVHLTLLKSKTRLAPLKTITIPRLELCGALLLAQLLKSLEHLKRDLQVEQIFCFTDSMIVLSWLKTQPYLLQTFVSNRVQQVHSVTQPGWWHHVRGSDNPADVGSRGVLPSNLKQHPLWWSGPSWSRQPIGEWPISSETSDMEVPELKKVRLSLVSVVVSPELVEYAGRHSSFTRFVRTVAYIKRFIHNAKIPMHLKHQRTSGAISAVEFCQANHHYIRLLQLSVFPAVFTENSFNLLPQELRRLDVFVDPEGIIRVGGRLANAPLSANQRHPIILPAKSYYTNLVVYHYHTLNHHAGPTALLASIRQEYWIPKAKNIVKHLRGKCPICTRFSRSSLIPFMGNLPTSRFAGIRPFLAAGVDFAGPFLYREVSGRRSNFRKAYLCLFLCMSSRALHLEIATSLSVEGFLDAFDRFVNRRGLPRQMLSDNGTNFRGSARYLQEVINWFEDPDRQASIVSHTSHLGVQWDFNPPSSPHFGGGWEVSVRVAKDLLYKTFGNQPYSLVELITLFAKIEGILNSRPLQPLSSSPHDVDALTPGHFLIGQPITAMPEIDLTDVPENRLNRWQLIRQRIQHFWSRWMAEYVSALQVRQKWDRRNPNFKVGELVLLQEDNTPPTHWPLARILEIHPGSDGVVRVVTLKTARSTYKRPATKLVPLHLASIHA